MSPEEMAVRLVELMREVDRLRIERDDFRQFAKDKQAELNNHRDWADVAAEQKRAALKERDEMKAAWEVACRSLSKVLQEKDDMQQYVDELQRLLEEKP